MASLGEQLRVAMQQHRETPVPRPTFLLTVRMLILGLLLYAQHRLAGPLPGTTAPCVGAWRGVTVPVGVTYLTFLTVLPLMPRHGWSRGRGHVRNRALGPQSSESKSVVFYIFAK